MICFWNMSENLFSWVLFWILKLGFVSHKEICVQILEAVTLKNTMEVLEIVDAWLISLRE